MLPCPQTKSVPVLSKYALALESHVKRRYLEKIAVIDVDPVTVPSDQFDPQCLPPVEQSDLFSYLVLQTSHYTNEQFKNYKSLEAYNHVVSGFVAAVSGKLIAGKHVVIAKVRHSQRMNDPLVDLWLIIRTDGAVISAHCLGCKAGLAESCSHVASVLFYLECWTRINGKLACTQVKCSWILPTYVKEVPYARVRDIDFTSAKKLKEKLDKKIDSLESQNSVQREEAPESVQASHAGSQEAHESVQASHAGSQAPESVQASHAGSQAPESVQASHAGSQAPESVQASHAGSQAPESVQASHAGSQAPESVQASHAGSKKAQSVPTEEEIGELFAKLNNCSSKVAALSLHKSYADQFVMSSREIPVVSDLFESDNLDLQFHELLPKCLEVKIELTDKHIDMVEKDTRTQAKGPGFFRHRAGRIGASVSGTVFHSNLAQPPQSTLKSICYPHLYKVNTKATRHGCEQEERAIDVYKEYMESNHVNLQIKKCGLFISKEHPYLHATPDFLVSCDCCGMGCGEVKCPVSVPNCNFDLYVNNKTSCLEKVNGDFRLKKSHSYYHQVQQQLFILSDKSYCDFVVCVWDVNGNPRFVHDRVKPDPEHSKMVLFKLQAFWRICVLPEILGRWYTRDREV
ncbi:hypothetical protein Bbelb_314220 [Branchiostoma belcheri]|nr:hypothetical protein Bbelb_314220 [Branchiostoma belcheri]